MNLSFFVIFGALLIRKYLSYDSPTNTTYTTNTNTGRIISAPVSQTITNNISVDTPNETNINITNTQNNNSTNADFLKMFNDQLNQVQNQTSPFDTQLDLLLNEAQNDPNQLTFIFNQALEGDITNMLQTSQDDTLEHIQNENNNDNDNDNSFTPVDMINQNQGNITLPFNTGNQTDSNSAQGQAVKNTQQQIQQANEAINNIFAQMNDNSIINSSIPQINFSPSITNNNLNSNNNNLNQSNGPVQNGNINQTGGVNGSNLARVVSNVVLDANGNPVQNNNSPITVTGSKN